MSNGHHGKDKTMSTYDEIQKSFLDEDDPVVNAIAVEIFKPSTKRYDPFEDDSDFLPLMKGEVSQAIAKCKTPMSLLKIEIRQIGVPGADGKENGPKWCVDIEFNMQHANFKALPENIREMIPDDGKMTKTFDQSDEKRNTNLKNCKAWIEEQQQPFRFVYLEIVTTKKGTRFQKFRTVTE